MSADPSFVEPMELPPVSRLPEGPDWVYGVKLDGYRAQAIQGARLKLLSRRGKDFRKQFANVPGTRLWDPIGLCD